MTSALRETEEKGFLFDTGSLKSIEKGNHRKENISEIKNSEKKRKK